MFFLCEYSCFACCVPGVIFFLFMYMLLDTLDCVIYHTRLSSFYGSEIDASIHLYLWWSPRLFWVFLVPRRTRDRRAISTILIHVLCMNTYNHHNNANPFMRSLESHTLSLPKDHFFAGCPSSLARSVAIWMPLAIVDLTLPSSRASSPAIVQPPGAGNKTSQIGQTE